jgi:branched-chain amino acid aminotransferase
MAESGHHWWHMRRPVWFEGKLVPPASATMSVMAHAAHRGSLVFDFGAFHETPGGVRVFRQLEHLDRFRRSVGLLGLELGYELDDLAEATRQTVEASELREGYVRWSAFVATSEPDLVPRGKRVSVAIAAYVTADMLGEGELPASRPAALRIAVFDDVRKAPPEVLTPLAKIGASYAGPMIAKRRALAAGADEIVLLDVDGDVAEGPTSNVFAVMGARLVTPPLGRILDGITRDSVLAIARAEGIVAQEQPISLAELASADEAFLTASSFPIAPIGSVNGAALRKDAPGEMTRRLLSILLDAERGRDARFTRWTSG